MFEHQLLVTLSGILHTEIKTQGCGANWRENPNLDFIFKAESEKKEEALLF